MNEANVPVVAAAFVAAANRQFGTDFTSYEIIPRVAAYEEGHDCVAISTTHGNLKLQVTRALQSDHYADQAKRGKRDSINTTTESVRWIIQAVERKRTRSAPDIALVIDGLDVAPIGIFADAAAVEQHRDFLNGQSWHSIWIMGHFGLRYLKPSIEKMDSSTRTERPQG